MNRGAGRERRRRGNRGRPPNPPAQLRAPLSLPQCLLNPQASTTTSGTTDGSLNQRQPPPGPLQPITRFCRVQDEHTPGAAPSTHSFMDNRFRAQVLRLLQDVTPSQREQLFWDVFTQLAEYFGQPYLPLHNPDFRSLTRLQPRPWNELTLPLYDPTLTKRYEEDFEEVKVLGDGGFGHVVKAKNRLDGCYYAIKKIVLDKWEVSLDRNLLEVQALALLNHPRVVRYHNAWLQSYLHPYHDMPFSPRAVSADGSFSDTDDDDEGEEDEAISEASSDMSDNGNDDSVVFRASGNGQRQTQSKRITKSLSHNGAANGMASQALLPYYQPSTVPHPKKVLYIQMGLCGESLKEWLDQRGTSSFPGTLSRCLELFQEMLEALCYIHEQGVIHRDVKPANIFFTLEGRHVQLGDFGLAKLSARSPTSLSSASNLIPITAQRNTCHVGTPLYTAPEVNKGIYGEKSDMYSMGVILLELVSFFPTDHQRFDDVHNLRSRRYLDPKLTHRWPDITSWILKLTDPEPDKRPSAKELLASSLFAQPFPPPPQPPPPCPNTTDITATPMTATPDPELSNRVIMLGEATSGIQNIQSDINGIGTTQMSSIKNSEALKVSHVKYESSIAINMIERHLSTDEENAVLREENFTLKRRVEELEFEIQRLKATDSTPPTQEK